MDTRGYWGMNTNAKIILITAYGMEKTLITEPGIIRFKLNVHSHAVEVRYIHTQIVDQNYELLITLIYIWIN